ncbi:MULTISPECIES: hypothetical protein [unclassified Microbacterium]|uniref:hypothetical protein n=1 Tax=unclassified Microbacterium TaxID=2609290 RepID=UPI001E62F9A4|nr:hypothetical protein [Microbacterium sp. Au-Mic1]MCE4025837.1 hypothetical protein [Microbacterium sp. Au-Mic1]
MSSASPVTSTPVLRTALIASGIAAVVLAIVAGIIGGVLKGAPGVWSGLIGALIAVLFGAITAASILIANRWFGQELYVQLFFAIVMGGWFLKLGLFFVLILVLRGQPWLEPVVFFWALLAGVLVSLAIDAAVFLKMRLPVVSDASLPTVAPEDVAPSAGERSASGQDHDADSGNSHV